MDKDKLYVSHISESIEKIVHDYFEIDLDAVWKTIKDDLPVLKKEILKS